MESTYTVNQPPSQLKPATTTRSARHKANGPATAALLIQMATEILMASPSLRQRTHITLSDLAAADKVRKGLLKTPAKL
jgi:hypothetical protein